MMSGWIEEKDLAIVCNGCLEMTAKLLVFFQAIDWRINGEECQEGE
jgi:hypothetical protein